MTGTAASPAGPTRKRRGWRRLRRGALALVLLLLLVWLFRQALVVPLLRPELEAGIADLLGADRVSIGAIDGDWFGRLEARDIVVEGGAPPLRAMRGVRVQARYSLLALLGGDPAGLRAATIVADEVEVDLRPAPPAPADAPAAATPATSAAFAPWLQGLAEGGRVQVERLRLVAPNGDREGALRVEVQPGRGERELSVDYAGVRVVVRAGAPVVTSHTPPLHAVLDARDPGALLDLFGLGAGVRGGTMHAELALDLAPWRLQGHVDLRDLAHGGQRLAHSRIELRLDRERLAIERASVDLPGIAVELREMALPSPFATGPVDLRDLAGRFVVAIDDLAAHTAVLPAPLRELLPIQGRIAGAAGDGMLRLDRAELRARGAELTIERGSMPLVRDGWRAAQGSLQFASTFAGFATELPWLGATTVSGRCAGSLSGSVDRPRLEVQLDLGECRCDRGGFAGAQGLLRADATGASAEGLRVRDLQVATLPVAAAARVELDARCGLREWRVVADSLAVDLEVGSQLPEALLGPWFAANGLGPGPTGPAVLQLRARHDADGIAIETLRLRSAPGSPVEVAVDGEGIVPVHWSGTGALAPLAAGGISLRLSAARATQPSDALPFALQGTLRLDSRAAALEGIDIAVGPARLRGGIALARGVGSLVQPDAGGADAPLRVALDLEELDLTTLPAAWRVTTGIAGRASGRLRASGSLRQLEPELLLTVADGELRSGDESALTAVQLRLELGPGGGAEETLVGNLRAAAKLAPRFGLDEEVTFDATVRSDTNGTKLEPAVLRIGGGELSLELASDARRADLFGLTPDASRTALTGTVQLREFALEKLPPDLLGAGAVRGLVSGEAAIDGVLGSPFGLGLVRTARLSLRGGELKLADLPRLDHLDAELHGDRHEWALRSLSGGLGAGRFSARGSLRRADAPLAESLADAELSVHLEGDDVLLYRGDGAKVRASIDATATGTLDAIVVRGDVALGRGTKYVRRISVLPALGSTGGAPVNEGLQLPSLPPMLGDRVDLDIAVTTHEPVEVRTHVVDGDIDVAGRLRGKGSAPRLEGTMSMRRGTLRFPGANLAVDSGLLTFTPSRPLFPELLVTATGKRMGIVVTMSITGRFDQPQVQLTSVPALPPQDLIVLLTTGQLPGTFAEQGVTGQARFVGGYLAKEVFEKYFGSESTERGESLFDRLTIESGREVSQNGTESVRVEYELLPRFSVQVERDAYEDYNLGLVLRFRFR